MKLGWFDSRKVLVPKIHHQQLRKEPTHLKTLKYIWLLFAAVFSTAGNRALGVSYNVINATAVSDLVAQNAKIQEELWVRGIIFGADTLYNDNPLADGFTEVLKNGAKPTMGRPITGLVDTEKVNGQVVNITTMAGFGGPGVYGEGTRDGNEQQITIGSFPCKVGNLWFGYGFKRTVKDQTVIGGSLDEAITGAAQQQLAKKRNDDHLMRLRQINNSGTNLIFPDGFGSRDELTGAAQFSTPFWTKGCDELPSQGAKPMNIAKDPSGSKIQRYLAFGTARTFRPLSYEPAYLDALKSGDLRGDTNAVFTGEYKEWLGQGIYRWVTMDHANNGPIGNPLEPRARLGVAINGAITGTVVYGGGMAYAAGAFPVPLYFEFFSNAPYTFFNGESIAAVTNVTRYIQIINPDGSFGVFPYQVCDGKTITISGAALAVGPAGKRTTNFVQNAEIVECNVLGQAFARVVFMGCDMLVCGYGSIDGKKVNPKMGVRKEVERNYGIDFGIGVESVWGNAPVKRTDGIFPNFLVGEVAIPTARGFNP